MTNLVLITSVINITNNPLSYTKTRSVFTSEERFKQTKKTIQTIKEKIPNNKIFLVECSNISNDTEKYLIENVDYFINFYQNFDIRKNIESQSKSLGENTLIIKAIDYLNNNNIEYSNFYKISGRYFLSDTFDYNNFKNEKIIVKNINNDKNNVITSLFKIPKKNLNEYYLFLINNYQMMIQCIGAEVLFAMFLNKMNYENVNSLESIGVTGNIAVSNDFCEM